MSSQASSLSAASRRPAAPSLTDLAAEAIINGADPAQETPKPAEGKGSGVLAKLKKPQKVQLTPLHCNIPLKIDDALRLAMKEGIEKTSIVVEGLKTVLQPYIAIIEMEDAAKTNQS